MGNWSFLCLQDFPCLNDADGKVLHAQAGQLPRPQAVPLPALQVTECSTQIQTDNNPCIPKCYKHCIEETLITQTSPLLHTHTHTAEQSVTDESMQRGIVDR